LQIGPEKGVTHLATAAIINALWDLWAKMEGKVKALKSNFHTFVICA
jgi:L-alanine-DL-glutamate epimerase-like enolase superfamily enzyme